MIIELLANIALGFFDLILACIPGFSTTGLNDAITYFFNVLSQVCYFLPMGTVSAIFSIIYALFILRILIATLKTIWGILPVL